MLGFVPQTLRPSMPEAHLGGDGSQTDTLKGFNSVLLTYVLALR
jgi:hypothetical protein